MNILIQNKFLKLFNILALLILFSVSAKAQVKEGENAPNFTLKNLDGKEINLNQNLEEAADLILLDRKHLDNNPKEISKHEIIKLLRMICDGKSFDDLP